MKRPSFLQGVGVAFVLSFFGAALFAMLTTFVNGAVAVRTLVSLVALAYAGYLLSRSDARVGRITVLAFSVLASGVAWALEVPLAFYLIVHVGLIWLIRALYLYAGVIPALMDLGLSVLALAAALWAALHSGSVFLAIWCFLLVQALHVTIPVSVERGSPAFDGDAAFQRARRAAEAAIARLSNEH
ncbi:MAG: hypothetical protein P8Y95_00375 [Gammaproteobacteria bacterium]|jgi:hypothetical protein